MKKSFIKKATRPSLEYNASGVVTYISDCPASLGIDLLRRYRDRIPAGRYRPLLGMFRYHLENAGDLRTGAGTYDELLTVRVDSITFKYRPIQDEVGALKGICRLIGGVLLLKARRGWSHLDSQYTNDFSLEYQVLVDAGSTEIRRPAMHEIEHPDDRNWGQWNPAPTWEPK